MNNENESSPNEFNKLQQFDEFTNGWTMADCVSFMKKIHLLHQQNEKRKIDEIIIEELKDFKPSGNMIDMTGIESFISQKSEIGVEFDLM